MCIILPQDKYFIERLLATILKSQVKQSVNKILKNAIYILKYIGCKVFGSGLTHLPTLSETLKTRVHTRGKIPHWGDAQGRDRPLNDTIMKSTHLFRGKPGVLHHYSPNDMTYGDRCPHMLHRILLVDRITDNNPAWCCRVIWLKKAESHTLHTL